MYVVTRPGKGADNPWVILFFKNINLLLICSSAVSSCHLITFKQFFFSFKCTGDQILPCCKIGQGQSRIIIYNNLVELESTMLHVKFQAHRTPGSGEEDF